MTQVSHLKCADVVLDLDPLLWKLPFYILFIPSIERQASSSHNQSSLGSCFWFYFLFVFSDCIFCLYFLIVFVKSKVKSKSKETVTMSTLWRWQHWEGYAMYTIHKNEDWQWRYIPISNSISSAYHSYDIRQNAYAPP